MADQGGRRPRPKRGPMKVERKVGSVKSEKTIHDERMEHRSGPRFVQPKTFRPRGALGMGVIEEIQNASLDQQMFGRAAGLQVQQEPTGFDVLQRHYDAQCYPTTLPEPGEAAMPLMSGFSTVAHTRWDDEKGAEKDVLPSSVGSRRYCEISCDEDGITFRHKGYAVKSEVGYGLTLENSTARLLPGSAKSVELKKMEDRIVLTCESEAEAALWQEALEKHARQDEDNRAFDKHIEETYGKGLDFLAEIEREDRDRTKNNLSLFGAGSGASAQLQEDELFLIQLPHVMPSAIQARPAQGAAAAQQRRATPSPPPAARRPGAPAGAAAPAQTSAARDEKAAGGITHKPGTGWMGRALGMDDHPPSLASIPPGEIGKIQVHKSGKIVMKIGECCFDLSSGGEASHAQSLMAVYEHTSDYSACDFGPQGCQVHSRADAKSPASAVMHDGDMIRVTRETNDAQGNVWLGIQNNGGWVPMQGVMGKWELRGEAQEAKAYELGQIKRKIVATASFEHFDSEQSI